MPTLKKRINITLSKPEEQAVRLLAKRDSVPRATKISQLMRLALEMEEDEIWNKIASQRDTADAVFVNHKKAWL